MRKAIGLILVVACGGSAVITTTSIEPAVSTTLFTTTTTRPPTTTTRPQTTTTEPPSTTTELALPEPANIAAEIAKEYGETLFAALRTANQLGCHQIVETIAFELAVLSEHSQAWWTAFSAADDDGSLDLLEFQKETILVADKLMYFGSLMDEVIEVGGGQAQYAASVKDVPANLGSALLLWAFAGINPEAGTFDLNQLEELGFIEYMGELVFNASDAENAGLAAQYCD